MKEKQLSKSDKSSIGCWDAKIKELCNKLNKGKDCYTTSSCGGRVVLLKASSEKIRDAFLFRSHAKVGFKELKDALLEVGGGYKGLVEFQQTSCILHVACSSLDKGLELVQKAKEAGWKRSGVMCGGPGRRVVVELHSTESMSFPIMDNGVILVDDGFLKLVVKIANEKLCRTWDKIGRLVKLV